MSGQALQHIVQQTILANADDAHIKVFQFLSSAGATEEEKKQLQTAWTRVSMASEAFGKNKMGRIDAKLFGSELVKELSADKKDLAKIEEMIHSFQALLAVRETNEKSKKKDTSALRLNSIHDLKKSGGVLANLTSMIQVGKDLERAQSGAYPASGREGDAAMSGSVESEEAILAHRRHARTAKFVFHGRKPAHTAPSYVPMSVKLLGMAEVAYGEAQYRHSIALTNHEKVARASSSPVIAVKVTSKQAGVLSKAFATYTCLHEILPSGHPRWRMFPVPLACQRPVDQPGPNLVFELPVCRPLLPLLGSAFSMYLRKFPSVILSWCAQIGAAMRALQNCVTGRLMGTPSINDVYVCENGHLTVGNVVFEESECNEASGDANSELADFFRDILASSLSLSRQVNCILKPSLTGQDENEEPPVTEEEEHEAQMKAAKRIDAAEQVISIVEGNDLTLQFTGHKCHGMKVLYTGEDSKDMKSANLAVHVHAEGSIADFECISGDSSKTTLRVSALKAGNVLLRVVAKADSCGGSTDNKSNVNYLALDLRLVVVPAYPVHSPDLLEVIADIQASYVNNNCDMFLAAYAFRLIHPETGEHAPESMMKYSEVDVHGDWTEIKVQMETHLAIGGKGNSKSLSRSHLR